ncbi:MAG: hypothetical protein CM1200mP2_26460 [Planctomycetaceae bacterium]|nr:MAG: hypothetical protein CM1200mP2_26460 [Planctomycetaceae bacterium]
MTAGPLAISEKTLVLPVIHGSGDFAVAVRRVMLEHTFDCLAVPLPPSFQADTESALQHLPGATVVLQHESPRFESIGWTPGDDSELEPGNPESVGRASHVPIDPCQPVIAALRTAVGEHIPRAFVDPETNPWEPMAAVLPDAYALKHVAIEQFASAILPALPRPPQDNRRIGSPTSLHGSSNSNNGTIRSCSSAVFSTGHGSTRRTVSEDSCARNPTSRRPRRWPSILAPWPSHSANSPSSPGFTKPREPGLTTTTISRSTGSRNFAGDTRPLRGRVEIAGAANHSSTAFDLLPLRPQPLVDRTPTDS